MMNDNSHRLPAASRLACLDGLRAVSILAVLIGHAHGTRGFPSETPIQWLGDVANLGVRVFFVISGFLITHLLLQESNQTGKISLKSFYIRRTFRIFPAFYAFLASVTILWLMGIVSLRPADLVWASTYTINYLEQKSWVVGHLWSLAVEEQFYLLWPFVLVLIGLRRAPKVLLAVVLVAPFFRIGTWYLLPELRGIVTKAFPTICDTIATGCLLACVRERLSSSALYRGFVESKAIWLIPVLVLVSNHFAFHTRPDWLAGQSVRNIGIAICLDWCLRHPKSALGTFLNHRILVWIGALSYSLYLWQQLFLNRHSDSIFCAFPINIALAFAFASLSYYLVERPCLRARVRLFPDSEQPKRSLQNKNVASISPKACAIG